jgi:glycosyltransferase involved in cell wall biosynthesis
MKFSIITPTLLRPSLTRTCESVQSQTYRDFEHIVSFDGSHHASDSPLPKDIIFVTTGSRVSDFGNTPRHLGWTYAAGDWCLYLDDDNYLADDLVLEDLATAMRDTPADVGFVLVPVLRFEHIFLADPPGVCRTDSANLVIRREFAEWPSRPEYTADGIFAEELNAKYKHICLTGIRPIAVVPVQSKGE